MIRRISSQLRREDGFTLVEMMVASMMAMIIVFAALSALDNVTNNEKGQQVRHSAMLEIRQAMTQFTRDLRQATWVDPTSTHNAIRMKTLSDSAEIAVKYDLVNVSAGLYELRRTLGTVATNGTITWSGTTVPVVTNMVVDTTANPDPPFCYSYYSAGSPSECIDTGAPPPELTAIRITIAKDPEHNPSGPITLATDVKLRNL
jgi:Tfp pilus assembly protein PilW